MDARKIPISSATEMLRPKHLIAALFFASLGLTLLGWIHYDRFADPLPWDPALADPPLQVRVDRAAFVARANDVDYRVQPLYRYELTGLVVSFKRFRPGIGLHERWNDYINVADVCVVWGDNAREIDLNAFDFWNLEFTCTVRTDDRSSWDRFDQDALANNHVLTTDPAVQAVIDELRVGDIVRFTGFLAEYGQPGGQVRGTSTSRSDRGNGACETLYLDHAVILGSMHNGWRGGFRIGLFGVLVAAALWFAVPHRHLR